MDEWLKLTFGIILILLCFKIHVTLGRRGKEAVVSVMEILVVVRWGKDRNCTL